MKFLLLAVTACMVLSGCYASCATGDPLGLFTYCPKESYEALMHPKPYGAHWVKDGMTRESRLQDYESCGGNKWLNSGFPDVVIRAETLPTDLVSTHSYNKDLIDNPLAEARLGKKRMICMQEKGYVWLESCDARCLYP
jgi:hypothetical protein